MGNECTKLDILDKPQLRQGNIFIYNSNHPMVGLGYVSIWFWHSLFWCEIEYVGNCGRTKFCHQSLIILDTRKTIEWVTTHVRRFTWPWKPPISTTKKWLSVTVIIDLKYDSGVIQWGVSSYLEIHS